MMKRLLKVRLSHYFFILLGVFTVLSFTIKTKVFTSAALNLFSVNSFLYGFYIAPILAGQKARIDELQKVIRAESNALFGLLLKTKKLEEKERDEYQAMFEAYIKQSLKERRPAEGEDEYEKLITFSLAYSGGSQDKVEKILESIVANQQNRSTLSMQLKNKVYSNEWWVMMVLFSITLGFILFLDIGTSWEMRMVKAFLCTGLTMLIVILVKLSTLTHKKAKELWQPLEKLLKTRFYRMD
jgi:hypothetical protein